MTSLRFSIRDLLWAMAVLGLVIGWGLSHSAERRRHAEEEREAEETVAALTSRIVALDSTLAMHRQAAKAHYAWLDRHHPNWRTARRYSSSIAA
jgi:hypothetical protein